MVDRDLMSLTCNLQIKEGISAHDGKCSFELCSLSRKRIHSNTQTGIFEEAIGTQKNAKRCKLGRKFSRPQKLMTTTLSTDVIGKRFGYDNVTIDAPLSSRTIQMPREAW